MVPVVHSKLNHLEGRGGEGRGGEGREGERRGQERRGGVHQGKEKEGVSLSHQFPHSGGLDPLHGCHMDLLTAGVVLILLLLSPVLLPSVSRHSIRQLVVVWRVRISSSR